jgi:excisionase family DNA binding protein
MTVDRFVSIDELAALRGVVRRTIYRQIDDKSLPPLRSFGRKRRGWYASDLAADKVAPVVARETFHNPASVNA